MVAGSAAWSSLVVVFIVVVTLGVVLTMVVDVIDAGVDAGVVARGGTAVVVPAEVVVGPTTWS